MVGGRRGGKEYDISQLGVRSQLVQHVESASRDQRASTTSRLLVTPGAPRLIPQSRQRGSIHPLHGRR